MPVVVGLDLSLKGTGVCVLSGDDTPKIELTRLLSRDSASGVRESIERTISISDEIIDIINLHSPQSIIIEAAAKNQVWQAAAIGEVHGVVKADILRRTGIVPLVEQATKIRKQVIGFVPSKRVKFINSKGKLKSRVDYGTVPSKHGKTKRATVKDIIEQRLSDMGLEFSSQDEMDAYVTAKYAWLLLKK